MLIEKVKKRFSKIKINEPLKKHCTFRVGGPADLFYELTLVEELPALVTFAEENGIPYRVIGRGTNVLFSDKGFRGLIIKNVTNLACVQDNKIIANSGAIFTQIVRLSVDSGLTGLEPFYGIPGSIGGAVFGNAGVPGTEIGDFVESVTLFNVSDGVREIPRDEIEFSYRSSSLQGKNELILSVTLALTKGTPEKSKELMQKIDEIRRGKQPVGYCAGSFFKNPSPDKPAGYLIDQAGLKGTSVGDAQISPKHGNFFMNRGKATTNDILKLAEIAKIKVKEKFGINLQMEVKIIDDL